MNKTDEALLERYRAVAEGMANLDDILPRGAGGKLKEAREPLAKVLSRGDVQQSHEQMIKFFELLYMLFEEQIIRQEGYRY